MGEWLFENRMKLEEIRSWIDCLVDVIMFSFKTFKDLLVA